MKSQDFFKEILRPDEKDKIIQDFVHSGNELHTKLASGIILTLKPYLLKKNSFLCHLSPMEKPPSEKEGIHNFSLNSERYFFKGQLLPEAKAFEVFFNGPLFQLQRRQTYRVAIPESFTGIVKIKLINDERVNLEGRLLDLSLGGCAMEIKDLKKELSLEDRIHAEFFLKKESLFESLVVVKRSKKQQAADLLLVGAEFYPQNTALQQRIFTLTLDIHRELYGRLL